MKTWEEKIVYYADKRVAHGEIVTFDERVRDAIERHNWTEKQLEKKKKAWILVKNLEQEIFEIVGGNPLPKNL